MNARSRRKLSILIVFTSVLGLNTLVASYFNHYSRFHPSPENPLYIVVHEQWRSIPWILDLAGNVTGGRVETGYEERRLGFAVSLNALDHPDEYIRDFLSTSFKVADETNLSILIHCDFEHFYDSRGDLWNFFDNESFGYDPDNVANVEWSDWDTPCEFGWLNWGRPIRLVPRLNYESPVIRNEIARKAGVIYNVTQEWRANRSMMGLPDLFIGIDTGWETAIDSYEGLEWVPEEERVHLGYGALRSRGYNKSNPPEDFEGELYDVVHDFAEFEAKVFFDLGIPKTHIFTHIVGDPGRHSPFYTAINEYSTPGFTIWPDSREYRTPAFREATRGRVFAAVEVNVNQEFTSDFLRELLFNSGQCKMVVIYNWGAFRDDPGNFELIREALAG